MMKTTEGIGMKRYGRTRQLLDKLRRFLKGEPPDDPYAYVGAPKKPRPSGRSAAAAERMDY